MRTFLTGATGYIGSAVLDALLRGGHEVTALARDPEKVERLKLRGVNAILGDLSLSQTYAQAAETCDAIIHTAFESSRRGPEVDRQAVDSLLGAAIKRASSKGQAAVVYTSGVWVLGNTSGAATEDAVVSATPLVAWRPAHEQIVLDAGRGRKLRTVVVRPGIVYGGTRGIIGDLLKDAANGLVRVIGDGRNHWACVYQRDLADLYVRLATRPEASGIYHANDQADERVADIIDAVASHARMQPDLRHVPIEEARAKMGPYADALALNQIIRSPKALALGWSPTIHSVSGNVARLLEEYRAKREAA